MRLGLMLAQRQDRRIPAVGFEPPRIVERKARVVTELRAGNAMWLVFVIERGPIPRQIALGQGGAAGGEQEGSHDADRLHDSEL
jgi:hypothetical protein